MKYTQKQLEKMSDFEINKLVAHAVYKDIGGQDYTKHLVVRYSYKNGGEHIYYCGGEPLDYCNNPNDIMPLVFECQICTTYSGGKATASKWHNGDMIRVDGENLLRSYAIVWILVNQE